MGDMMDKARAWDALVQANARIAELRQALVQARREYGAFGTLSGETLVQMERAIGTGRNESRNSGDGLPTGETG